MEKIAMIKQAEVNGVMAALLETELVKVASEEDFDAVTSCIADSLSDDYDMEEVLAKTAEVMEEYYELLDGNIEKEAEEAGEVDETAVMAAYGHLTLAKEAGDISEEEFEKEAASLKGLVEGGKNLASNAYRGDIGNGIQAVKGKASNLGSYLKGGFTGEKLRAGASKRKAAKTFKADAKRIANAGMSNLDTSVAMTRLRGAARGKVGTKAGRKAELKSGIGQIASSYGTAAAGTAGAAGAAYGGKNLYDKYKK